VSSFIANAHYELYAFHIGNGSLLKKYESIGGPHRPLPLNLPLMQA